MDWKLFSITISQILGFTFSQSHSLLSLPISFVLSPPLPLPVLPPPEGEHAEWW